MRLAAVSVDLDEIPNYYAIHGLPAPSGAGKHAVYDRALDRLEDLARAHQLPLTLFAIGADMAREQNARRLRELAARGHEISNHSLDHRYDLIELPRDEVVRQVESGIKVLEGATGVRPTGFRAPGYRMSDELIDVLAELGVDYDSSVFPSPAYFAAKVAAKIAIALRGRTSRSRYDDVRVLAAPTRPYRAGRPYWKRGDRLLELPVQVTRGPRLPFIGTTLTLVGPDRARLLTRFVVGEPLVNLELHGIDLLDASDDLEPLRKHQPDVRVPLQRKRDALSAVIETLRDAGYSFVRLDEAAKAFARS
jgi:peptidoglycan/xylan/chitin deacetylase (PgdA/CDA1 family)